MSRLVVIPADPLYLYLKKGEVKNRYWNPCDMFKEMHILDLSNETVKPEEMQAVAGSAKLTIHSVGEVKLHNLPFFYPKIKKIVSQIKPDLIRAHGPRPSSSLAVYAGKKNNIPVVSSVHNEGDQQRKFEKNWKFYAAILFELHTFKNSNAIICVSDYLQPYVKKYGGKNIVTIYNKVYIENFKRTKPKDEKRNDQKLEALTVMRLDNQKDPFTLVEAIKNLNIHLTIIGQGECEKKLKQHIESLNLSNKVTMIPSVPNKEIVNYYHNSDIFMLSTKYEGFCIPILEAMASGVPVIACDTMPIPEVLGDTGVIVKRSVAEFNNALDQLIKDPTQLNTIATQQLKRALTIDGNVMEQKEKELYLSLLKDKK